MTRTAYISSTKYGLNQLTIDKPLLKRVHSIRNRPIIANYHARSYTSMKQYRPLLSTRASITPLSVHSVFNITQPGLCRSGGANYGTKYYTDTELRGYIITQHSTKKCLSIPATALYICNLCLTMPPYEFVQYPFQLKYVNTSTNQEELKDELILSEDHSESPAYS